MKRKFFTFKPFIDVLFCCLLMLVAILFLLKTEEEKTKMRPPNVIYEVILTWDGESNDDESVDATVWYLDADEDTYGDLDESIVSCEQPTGYVSNSSD